MKFIPRDELTFIVDHLDEEDVCKLTIEKVFNVYGDDWFVEGTSWIKCRENKKRKNELERLGYKGVKEIQD